MRNQHLIGKVFSTKNYGKITITSYRRNTDISVLFEDGTKISGIALTSIKKGLVKNPNHKTVYDVACIGIGKYNSRDHKKAYNRWLNILERCYCKKRITKYSLCEVSKEWLNFQNFADWFYRNHIDGWEIDKDLLVKNNNTYSEKTCVFLPEVINKAFIKSGSLKRKHNLPKGVMPNKKRFSARISKGNNHFHLGTYDTKEVAHDVYLKEKSKYIKELAKKFKKNLKEEVYLIMINYEF